MRLCVSHERGLRYARALKHDRRTLGVSTVLLKKCPKNPKFYRTLLKMKPPFRLKINKNVQVCNSLSLFVCRERWGGKREKLDVLMAIRFQNTSNTKQVENITETRILLNARTCECLCFGALLTGVIHSLLRERRRRERRKFGFSNL